MKQHARLILITAAVLAGTASGVLACTGKLGGHRATGHARANDQYVDLIMLSH